jgi:hypothetical protein
MSPQTMHLFQLFLEGCADALAVKDGINRHVGQALCTGHPRVLWFSSENNTYYIHNTYIISNKYLIILDLSLFIYILFGNQTD